MAAPVAEEDSFAVGYSDPPLAKNYLSKRKKSKPIRFEVLPTEVETERHPPKIKIVVNNTSIPSLSLKKRKSPTKRSKSPTPSTPAMILAEEFQSSLGTEFPSCMKLMIRTTVTYGFWMGLPLPFCRSFLPKQDCMMVLEDEIGEKWEVKYIANKNGLSAGWKIFVVAHDLIEGDVLVFHLIETYKLKIYIIKASEPNEVDGAIGLLNLEPQKNETEIPPDTPPPKTKKHKHVEVLDPLPINMVKKKQKKSTLVKPIEVLEHSGTNSEEIGSEVLEPFTSAPIQDLKSLDHFRIKVNGQCIDSELPEEVKLGYYKLCIHKKQILHDCIRENIYDKLVVGMIGETVTIAKEIKNCKLTISKEELEAWDNSLKSFEILGMKVGFLREKIRTLVGLLFESEFGVDVKRYVEAKKEEKGIQDEIMRVKGKLLELKIKARNFEGELAGLKDKAEKYMMEFRDEVDVPW
ncbi:unnamed protein product [Lactuca virosa]|uniref:TF-B3 domain-containing protein n=1 Tax=Lactuca virosa TaxID=75947 RepID=A0AAU9MAF1_9ASTR|nr:unnamed protein product [Lactuca virosa]